MAYYDYNGTITIDENAARADINRIQSAIPKLTAVSGILERMIQEGCSAQGETALAIVEKAGDLNRQVSPAYRFVKRGIPAYPADGCPLSAFGSAGEANDRGSANARIRRLLWEKSG